MKKTLTYIGIIAAALGAIYVATITISNMEIVGSKAIQAGNEIAAAQNVVASDTVRGLQKIIYIILTITAVTGMSWFAWWLITEISADEIYAAEDEEVNLEFEREMANDLMRTIILSFSIIAAALWVTI